MPTSTSEFNSGYHNLDISTPNGFHQTSNDQQAAASTATSSSSSSSAGTSSNPLVYPHFNTASTYGMHPHSHNSNHSHHHQPQQNQNQSTYPSTTSNLETNPNSTAAYLNSFYTSSLSSSSHTPSSHAVTLVSNPNSYPNVMPNGYNHHLLCDPASIYSPLSSSSSSSLPSGGGIHHSNTIGNTAGGSLIGSYNPLTGDYTTTSMIGYPSHSHSHSINSASSSSSSSSCASNDPNSFLEHNYNYLNSIQLAAATAAVSANQQAQHASNNKIMQI